MTQLDTSETAKINEPKYIPKKTELRQINSVENDTMIEMDDQATNDNDNKNSNNGKNNISIDINNNHNKLTKIKEIRRVSSNFGGKNKIYCDRKYIGGSELHSFVGTWLLMNVPSIPYYLIISLILSEHNIILFILMLLLSLISHAFCIYFLIRTHFTDPGIIQRPKPGLRFYGPLNQKDRYCYTCNVIRPTHAKHCRSCDNCVLGFDHHCPWVGTCIGSRNIRYFLGFITFAGLYGGIAFISCILICVKYPSFGKLNLISTIGVIIMIIYCSVMAFMLLGMSCSYFFMIPAELTLNEKINNKGKRVVTDAEKLKQQQRNSNPCYVLCGALCEKLPQSQVYESL